MLKNLALLFCSTLISILLLEAALRLIMPERLAFVPTLLNNDLTYEPDQYQRARHIEWDYEIRINEDGFRNDRTLSELPQNSFVALGDSFTEGYGVALEDSYPKQLERHLNTNGKSAHIYNAGHYGTGLANYRAVYQAKFRPVAAPNTVIIGVFIGNDMLTTSDPPNARLQLGNEFGDGWRYRLKVFLGSHVATYSVLNHVIKANPSLDALCKKLGACYAPHPPNIYSKAIVDKMIPPTRRFIVDFAREIAADGRKLLILIIPTREQVDDGLWRKVVLEYGGDAADNRFRMNQSFAKVLKSSDIEFVDLTQIAVDHQRRTGERLYFQNDGHWNSAGHRLAAETLAAFVRK